MRRDIQRWAVLVAAGTGLLAAFITPCLPQNIPKIVWAPLAIGIVAALMAYAHHEQKKIERNMMQKVQRLFAERPGLTPAEFAQTHFQEPQQAVAREIMELMQRMFPFDIARAVPDDRIHEDLELRHWNDLGDAEMIHWIEKKHGIRFQRQPLKTVSTIRDLVSLVHREITVQQNNE